MTYIKEIQDFISSYQKLISKIQADFLNERRFIIKLNSKSLVQKSSRTLSLIADSNISKAPNFIRHIYFTDEVLEVGEMNLFAGNSNYGFHYALSNLDTQIVLLDQDFQLAFQVAQNEQSFFKVLTLLAECELLVLTEEGIEQKKICLPKVSTFMHICSWRRSL